jgi:class 3 adenylate cyclase
VQIGVHTGLAVIGTLGDGAPTPYSVVGSTRHLAAQLTQHAEPGTILISDMTARQVGREVRLKARGTVSLTLIRTHKVMRASMKK